MQRVRPMERGPGLGLRGGGGHRTPHSQKNVSCPCPLAIVDEGIDGHTFRKHYIRPPPNLSPSLLAFFKVMSSAISVFTEMVKAHLAGIVEKMSIF